MYKVNSNGIAESRSKFILSESTHNRWFTSPWVPQHQNLQLFISALNIQYTLFCFSSCFLNMIRFNENFSYYKIYCSRQFNLCIYLKIIINFHPSDLPFTLSIQLSTCIFGISWISNKENGKYGSVIQAYS